VIGGYTPAGRNFDAIIFGYYDGEGRLVYAARTRNGFTPVSRDELFRRFRGLETAVCPFANLPEARSGRWGEGLTTEKMAACRWLRPELVGQVDPILRVHRFGAAQCGFGIRGMDAGRSSQALPVCRAAGG